MTTTVGVIGAGPIGGATAHALAASDRVDRIVIVDATRDLAAGKALDIQQSCIFDPVHTRLEGTDDSSRLTACSACIIADRVSGDEWREDDGLTMLMAVLPYLGRAPLVFAGAHQSGLLAQAARELAVERRRLLGSAPEAFASAVAGIVAMEADCSAADVAVSVLGVPPSFLVPWSHVSVFGYGLAATMSQVQLARIEARTESLWPPGPTALGAAASRVVEGIVTASRRSFCVLTQLDGEFGVRNRPGALPARLFSGGIARTTQPEITTRERVRLQTVLSS